MAGVTIAAGKAKRSTLMFFFKVPGGSTPAYELIGKGIEEASISQSAQIDSVTDILGNTETTLSSYEKSTDLDPVYVEGGNKFSEWLDDLEEKEGILDDAKATFLVVKAYKTSSATSYTAWEQEAIVELTDFGGDTKGVNAPCTLHWVGERKMGTFNPTTKTFTVGGGSEMV